MDFHELEIISIISSVIFIWCIIRQQIAGWIFGITASVCSVIYFYQEHLISSAWLNMVYVLSGIYGWINWGRSKVAIPVKPPFSLRVHILVILTCLLFSFGLSYIFYNIPEIKHPEIDALLAVFSVAATIMEARKQLSGWYYWIIINFSAAAFYTYEGSQGYGLLSLIFACFSIKGLLEWRKAWLAQ